MPRVTCRCGHSLTVPADGPERVVCPKCSARIRVRRIAPGAAEEFIRFACPCGRRLKVKNDGLAKAGKCPDCGRIVPVPTTSTLGPSSDPEAPTEEMNEIDRATLERWAQSHLAQSSPASAPAATGVRAEAGLRVCPRCGRP